MTDFLAAFSELEVLFANRSNGLFWPCVFSLPGWMSAWWQYFGAGYEPLILILRSEGQVTGIAALKRRGQNASFIGDDSVCDYLDFMVVPGREESFFVLLFRELGARGIGTLELGTLRPDSAVQRHLLPLARKLGLKIECRDKDVSFEMQLPDNYEAYMANLESKQRRDLMRKQRNLEMETGCELRMLKDTGVRDEHIELFLSMMAGSRSDKAGFLTPEMRGFFKEIARAMSGAAALRLGFLDLGTKAVASVMCFDYNNTKYLYNSGYDEAYAELSVGLLSKLACIRWAIEQKRNVFDFLKGSEIYKERLGGRQVNLSSCILKNE